MNTQWFTLTAGYILFFDKITTNGDPNAFGSFFLAAYAGQQTSAAGTPFVEPGNPGFQPAVVSSRSDAWFVQPEIHILPTVDLVGGARITVDNKSGYETLPDQFLADPTRTVQRPVKSIINYKDSEATFSAGVNWEPSRNILAYAKYADGYISGGELASITFKPERAYSYEVGLKTELFDRRLRSNLALFHVDYKAIQFTTSGALTGVASSALYGQAVVSSGDATAKGLEWENTFVPIRSLTLGANVGYTDFKFDQNSIFPGFKVASGAPGYLSFARPKWTINLSAQYASEEILAGGHIVARIDGNFRSKSLMTSDVTRGSGLTIPADPGIVSAATIPATWLVNGRLGLSQIDFGRAKADVFFWGKNIFNNRQITQYTGFDLGPIGYVGSVLYERARTFGIDLTVNL